MISGVLFMGAAGYGLIRGVHIRADGSYRNWEKNTSYRGLKLISLIFIPSMIFFTIVSTKFWWLAYSTSETMQIDSAWGPLLWPAHTAMPAGEFLLLIQGIPEIFHAIYKMGRARERVFVKALPFYVIVLLWFILTVFIPDLVPGGEWFTDLMKARPGLSKPTIGLIMLSAMLFVIFIRFPISFTLIFLAFIFGICGANFKLTTLLFTLNTNSTMLNDQFMAVPLFFLIGIIMERAGLIVLTIFAAATGIVCASMTLLGIMAEAKMNKQNKMFKLLLAPLLQARHLAF